jgi:tryptophan halogenase
MGPVIRNVVVVGGGTSGWISAALLAKVLGKAVDITLVESDDISTIGVGEATIPPILTLNKVLGLDEADFMRHTQATIKVGIQFENWGTVGNVYMHAFGTIGKDFAFCPFQHFWLRAFRAGLSRDLWEYSLNLQAARQGKFAFVKQHQDMPALTYAYHFDAGLYARYLREVSEKAGVQRIEGMIAAVRLHPESGCVESLHLKDGREVRGDFFIDCSGFRGLLIQEALNTGYEDWTHWLPCDRAVAVPSDSFERIVPYTRSIAHDAGWQWQIPLQHRNGNGLVYSSQHISDDEAAARLLGNLGSTPRAEPRVIRFRTGRRREQWHRNVVAVGLSSGFLEPLESTSIHLIQSAVTRLAKHFPFHGIKASEVREFNRQSQIEFEHIRDFIIAHYWLTERTDTEFWRQCRSISIPDTLRDRIQLFRDTAKVYREQDELFSEVAWVQIMIGQGVMPTDYHPMAAVPPDASFAEMMASVRTIVQKPLPHIGTHEEFLRRYCAAGSP